MKGERRKERKGKIEMEEWRKEEMEERRGGRERRKEEEGGRDGKKEGSGREEKNDGWVLALLPQAFPGAKTSVSTV